MGMEFISKGVASKVTSGRDQTLCFKIISAVGCVMPEAEKVIRGWDGVEEGAGIGGGAILAFGSVSPKDAAISSIAFLNIPVKVGCFVFWSFPSYPKNLTKNFGWRTLHQAVTVSGGRPCRDSPGMPLWTSGKPPTGGLVKRVSLRVDELKVTMSMVVSATVERVWKRSGGLLSVWG